MRPIQFLLAGLVATGVLMYVRSLKTRVVDRVVVLTVGLVGLVLVAIPDWSTTLALTLGVGRGADLVLYLGLVGLGWVSLLLFAKLRETDQRLTQLARAIAVQQAVHPQPARHS